MKAFSAGGRTHPKQHDMCLLILQTLIPADLFMQSVFLAVVPIALAGLGSRQKAALIWQHFLDLRAILTETSAMAVQVSDTPQPSSAIAQLPLTCISCWRRLRTSPSPSEGSRQILGRGMSDWALISSHGAANLLDHSQQHFCSCCCILLQITPTAVEGRASKPMQME